LAVGFASQSLIKDVINGLFILFEDSISVGDIATLHGIGGQVEKITLRAVTLRGLDGTVHVIPNSAIDVASNMTKGFSRYVLDVRVALTEDVDKVMDVLRKVDEEMRGDPEFGKDMLFPIELWGLERFEDTGLIIRARLNTKPIEQWRIGREFNRRMKQAFEAEGIQMAVTHRMLFLSTPPNRQDSQSTVMEDYPPSMGKREPGAERGKT
jgi:small conductance mechanosensitive channel